MKDYSLNEMDRKDFVLDFDVIKDGNIIVNYADGKRIPLPYNEKNEQILIQKMEEQVKEASSNEKKYIDKKREYLILFYGSLVASVISTGAVLVTNSVWLDTVFALGLSLSAIYGVSFIARFVHIRNLLEDLQKNKKFLVIQDKINKNIRSNNHILVNVSKNTKEVINIFPQDKPMFNINTFNFVPDSDIETIIENIDRNEKFGFDYTQKDKPVVGMVKKRIRK